MLFESDEYDNLLLTHTREKPKKHITNDKLLLSIVLLIMVAFMLSFQMVTQELFISQFSTDGGILYRLVLNETTNTLTAIENGTCNGPFDCVNEICEMVEESDNVHDPSYSYLIGFLSAGSYQCNPTLVDIFQNLYKTDCFSQTFCYLQKLSIISFAVSFVLSGVLLVACFLAVGKKQKILKWVYLAARFVVVVSYILNMIAITLYRSIIKDYPPLYFGYLERIGCAISILAYIAEVIIYWKF